VAYKKLGEEKREATKVEVEKLLQIDFIQEVRYTTCLENIILVRKTNNKWHMCINYTNLNKACPEDIYPLPNIGRLVDIVVGQNILIFLDADSGFNQIPMDPRDKLKTTFIIDNANFYYEVMPVGLKNIGAT